MARPFGYYTKDRQRVPSVTTFLKHMDSDSEGLIRWAWKLGHEGKSLDEARQAAADVGTVTHAAIEADLKGETVDLSGLDTEMRRQVDASLAAWQLWKQSVGGIEIIASECSLVTETLRFGGTLDAILMVNGKRILFDFKTGARLYPKEIAQIAAYGFLWEEHNPCQPIEGYSLLRLGKEDGSFTWKHLGHDEVAPAMAAVQKAREIYDLAKHLAKVVA